MNANIKRLLCTLCLTLSAGLLYADEIRIGVSREELASKYKERILINESLSPTREPYATILMNDAFGKPALATVDFRGNAAENIDYNFHFDENVTGGRLKYFSELMRAMEAEDIENKETFVRLNGVTLVDANPEVVENFIGVIAKLDPRIATIEMNYTPRENNLIIFQFTKSGIPYSLGLHGEDYGTLDATAHIELKVGKDEPILISAPL